MKILIVDDEEAIREFLVWDFEDEGFEVFEAEGGDKAFEILQEQKIDVVLSDVRMPKGDAISLLDKMAEASMQVPVYLMTGHAGESQEVLMQKGVQAIFDKPIDMGKVLETLRSQVAA